jgi:hypothetical protein
MTVLVRDILRAHLASTSAPDYQQLAADVLGIRNAPPDLARRLVRQALVVEDRREEWRRAGERICRDAPATPGVYVLRDATGRAVYVGKAVSLRRRLRAHFAERRWRALRPEMASVAEAEWIDVGSELEALLREAALIAELQPVANVQVAEPAMSRRSVPRTLISDVIVIVPSVESDSAELVAARAEDGGTLIQRTRRNGADLAVHTARLWRFFNSALRHARGTGSPALAPIVFSWLARRGDAATRIDPHAVALPRELRARFGALLKDDRLFRERLDQR